MVRVASFFALIYVTKKIEENVVIEQQFHEWKKRL